MASGPSDAEFATWLTPPDALASLDSSWSFDTKTNWILKRLATGKVKAATEKGLIHTPMWKPRWHWFGNDFWQTGDLTFFDGPDDRFGRPIPGVPCTTIEMHGVKFDPAGFPSPPGTRPKGGTPTPAEFEHWPRPGEVLERFHPAGDVAERKRAIIRRLATGRLRAGGYGDAKLVVILAARWRDWRVNDLSLWTIGDVTFSRGGRPSGGPILFVDGEEYNPPEPEESVTFTEVRFDPESLGHEFSSAPVVTHAPDEPEPDQPDKARLPDAWLKQWHELFVLAYPNDGPEQARKSVAGMFPRHHVSRDRVRALFPNRDKGRPRKNKDNP